MLLIRLRLENFRQHRDTVIDFQEGMTAIVGSNGSGKSTVLEGITYALYGTQRDTRETIRFFWGEKKKYLAELLFELDGRHYLIERSNTDASLIELGADGGKTSLAVGLSDVRRAAERLLGLNYEQFINSFSAEQKNLIFLNFRTAAARQDEVARMLGFDRLKRAEDLGKERRSELKTRADTLEKTLGNLADLKRDQEEAAAKLKTVQAEIAQFEKEKKELDKKLGPAKELRDQAERWQALSAEIIAIRGEANGLKEAVKLTEAALAEAQKGAAEIRELEPQEAEYRRLEVEHKEWDRRREEDRKREQLSGEAKTLAAEVADLDARLKELELPDMGSLEKALVGAKEASERAEVRLRELDKAWSSRRSKLEQSLAVAKARLEIGKKSLAQREAMLAKGVCPECGQPLADGYTPILEKAREEVQEAQAQADRAASELSEIAAKPDEVTAAEQTVKEAKAALADAQKSREAAAVLHAQAKTLMGERTKKAEILARSEAKLANMPSIYDSAKHETIRKSLEALDPIHLRYLGLKGCEASLEDREKDHKQALANLQATKSRYKSIEAERGKLPFPGPAEAAAALAEYQALEMHARDVASCLRNSTSMKEYAEAAVAQAKARVEEHHVRKKELEEARKAASCHDTVTREMRALREKLNRTIGPDLAARASENLNLLTNGRYTVLELNKDFEATVVEDGIPKPVISGGEEDVVALALRLALSELIQERNGRPMMLLVLDEVFGSLDVERRQSVLDRLASLKGRFRQILVISHIEEINQVADQALFLSRDPVTRSTVVSDAPPDANAMLL